MTTATQRRGVYQDGESWTWYNPDTQTQGGQFASRGQARQDYSANRTSTTGVAPSSAGDSTSKPAAAPRSARAVRRASTRRRTPGSVAKAWSIFNRMPKAQRKDALAAAVKAGINLNTAKTQYQAWLHRGDK